MQVLAAEEKKRLLQMCSHEKRLRELGFVNIAGVDEAGRGPLAGPVVAAACILPPEFLPAHLNDSKQLTSQMREELYGAILASGALYGICIVSSERIDEINILQATFEAMQQAILLLPKPAGYLLIDGNRLPPLQTPAEAIVEGDSLSLSIAAASILAKVTRDRLMKELSKMWPQYGFEKHKGYGTKAHLEALKRLGPCPLHRKSFAPVKYLSLTKICSLA